MSAHDRFRGHAVALLVVLASVVLALAGCTGSPSGREDGRVGVFASTNVWGAVAEAVGGDAVAVDVGVARPDQDPHDYEATVTDKLHVIRSSVVVVNGGGYDDWALQLVDGADGDRAVVNAVDVSGVGERTDQEHPTTHDGHDHAAFNEHVFYDLHAVSAVAARTEQALAAADPDNAQGYAHRLRTFQARLDALEHEAALFRSRHDWLTAVATEPVAGYLMEELGIRDLTPEGFVEQSEAPAGPSVKVVEEMRTALRSGQVDLLVLNAQTQDPISDDLRADAESANVPVVEVDETLPGDVTTYAGFLEGELHRFVVAARGRT